MASLTFALTRFAASNSKVMGVFDPKNLRLVKTGDAIALFSKDRMLAAQYLFESDKDRNIKYNALVKLLVEARKAVTPLRIDRQNEGKYFWVFPCDVGTPVFDSKLPFQAGGWWMLQKDKDRLDVEILTQMVKEDEPDLWKAFVDQHENFLATIEKHRAEGERPGLNVETLRKHQQELDRQVAEHHQIVQKLIEVSRNISKSVRTLEISTVPRVSPPPIGRSIQPDPLTPRHRSPF